MKGKSVRIAFLISFVVVFAIGCGGGGGVSGSGGSSNNNGRVAGEVNLPEGGAGRAAGGASRLNMAALPRNAGQLADGTTAQVCELSSAGLVTTNCYEGAVDEVNGTFTITDVPTDIENMILQILPPDSTDPIVEAIVPAVYTGTEATQNPVYCTYESDAEADIAKELIGELDSVAGISDPVGELDIIKIKETITPDMALSADFVDPTTRGQIISSFATSLKDSHKTYRDQLKAAGASDADIANLMKKSAREEVKKELLMEKAHYEGLSLDSLQTQLDAIEAKITTAKKNALDAIANLDFEGMGLEDAEALLGAIEDMAADDFIDKLNTYLTTNCAGCDTSLVELMEAVGEAKELLADIREKLEILMPSSETGDPVPPPLKILAHILQIDWSIIEAQMSLIEDARLNLEESINDPSADPNMARQEFHRTIKNVRDALLTTYVGISYEGIAAIEQQLIAAQEKVRTALDSGSLTPTVMDTFHTDVAAAFADLDSAIPENPNDVTLTAENRDRVLWAVRDIFIHTTINLPPDLIRPKDTDGDGCPDFIDSSDSNASVTSCPKPTDMTYTETTLTDSDGDGYPDEMEMNYGTDPSDGESTPGDVAGTDPVFCMSLAGSGCTEVRPSDGIDNDGDGKIDEELLDGIDNDDPKDGRIDEDTVAPDDIPTVILTGTIINDGVLVAGAYAGLFLSPDFLNQRPVNGGGPTAADGKFTIYGVKPGAYFVAGFKDYNKDGMPTKDCDAFGFYGKVDSTGAFIPFSVNVEFGDTEVAIDQIVVVKDGDPNCAVVEVTNYGAVSGTVQKSDGTAVAGAKIALYVPPDMNFNPPVIPEPVITDSNGAFTIEKVPVGIWEAVAYIPVSTSATATSDEIKRLSMIVEVTAGVTANADFMLFDDVAPCMMAMACPPGSFMNYECRCVCDQGLKPMLDSATGAIEECVEPPATCDLACTGEHEILLSDICDCGCEKGYIRIYEMTEAGGMVEVVAKCAGPVGSLGGKALTTDGKPVPGANIHFKCSDSVTTSMSVCQMAMDMGYMPPEDIYTDGEGKFFIGAIPTGNVDVKAVSLDLKKYGLADGIEIKMAEQAAVAITLDTTLDSSVCPEGAVYDATHETCVFDCPPMTAGLTDMACIMLWAPVCGWLEGGAKETYSNDCVACTSGNVAKYIKGECPAASAASKK